MKLGSFGRGDGNMHLSFTSTLSVGLGCGTIMVARIRTSASIGCEIRKLWKGWRKYACLFYSYPYLLGSDVRPLCSQGLEGISVSIGCEIRKRWKR